MFNQDIDSRLSLWFEFRKQLEYSKNPLQEAYDFWNRAPFVPYNNNIDPFNKFDWPTPWEIIVKNKYDDFTKALMIGWTLKLTERFKNTPIEIRTIVDNIKSVRYNIIIVDNKWVLNFDDFVPVNVEKVLDSFLVENLIEVTRPK